MLDSKTISVSVDHDWQDLYAAFWQPEAFPRWASGLSNASLEKAGEDWKAQGPQGPIGIKFTAHNAFGVMDHWVDLGDGRVIYVPLRIIANATGADVQLTLFRQPDMTETQFAADGDWVMRDLLGLKTLAERA